MADIHFLGHACVRIKGKDGTVICDPYQRMVGYDIGKPAASIVTVSHQHDGHNNTAAVKPLKEKLFVVDGPGEYEIGGILISGVRTFHDRAQGAERGYNTVYVIHLDDLSFCHLGDLGHELTSAQLAAIGPVDVLFIPVGGDTTISPAQAPAVIAQLEPRLVVPIHYAPAQPSFDNTLEPIERFAHEIGIKEIVSEDKLTVTAAGLPAEGEPPRISVLRPVSA
jgi:L-ascorbate metabolism protein UlaG (beta-lactamase superfamily)